MQWWLWWALTLQGIGRARCAPPQRTLAQDDRSCQSTKHLFTLSAGCPTVQCQQIGNRSQRPQSRSTHGQLPRSVDNSERAFRN